MLVLWMQPLKDFEWGHSTARVNCVSWSEDGQVLATGSLDTTIIVYALKSPMTPLAKLRPAHPLGSVTGVLFLDAGHVASVGTDGSARLWALA